MMEQDAADFLHPRKAASIRLFLDDAAEPIATFQPPATFRIDTSTLEDGDHVLRVVAMGADGKAGVRRIPFVVRNGPGIAVSGLRANEAVSGFVDLQVDAFSATASFDAEQAESQLPVPAWAWILLILFGAWACWYGLEDFLNPAFTHAGYGRNPIAAATEPMHPAAPETPSGREVAGFDYGKTGPRLYAAHCAGCHGPAGEGVPGAFPPMADDPVVNAKDPREHISAVLHGVKGKAIGGKSYASPMPAFAHLSDAEIAAIIDHQRTSWGNNAPVVTPDAVKAAR
jgi:mono/diheme cytochrome c family protein